MINNPFARPRQTLTDKVGKEILNRITSGKWPAGFTLPSEIELAALFDVSQGTVRRALKDLVDCGLLIRQQGKGHICRQPKPSSRRHPRAMVCQKRR